MLIPRVERNIYLLVAYGGTEFHGWQNQPGLGTVQGVLEQAIRRPVRHQVDLASSGRTASGVAVAGTRHGVLRMRWNAAKSDRSISPSWSISNNALPPQSEPRAEATGFPLSLTGEGRGEGEIFRR